MKNKFSIISVLFIFLISSSNIFQNNQQENKSENAELIENSNQMKSDDSESNKKNQDKIDIEESINVIRPSILIV